MRRAKVRITSVRDHGRTYDPGKTGEQVRACEVEGGGIELSISVTNPDWYGYFEVGKVYEICVDKHTIEIY
jgi:hypothetical protein